MRHASWALSLVMHIVLAFVLLQAVNLRRMPKDVMEVDLIRMEPPAMEKPELANLKLPPPRPQPDPVPSAPEAPHAPAPLPMDKTVVLDPPAPPPPTKATPEPEARSEPEVVEISPVKVPEKRPDDNRKKIMIRQDAVAHRGAEARFGRALMADYYSYSEAEFSGQFKTRDNRTITIIDARETKYGRFLIYDSKHKTLRRLKRFNKYIYTIGPSIHEDEPVVGSVTFLAMDDRIERFILMTDNDRLAYYPRKFHVREKDVSIPMGMDLLPARLSLPPQGDTSLGVIFVHGNACTPPGLIQGFTRSLSTKDVAVLWFEPRGCKNGEGTPESEDRLISDLGGAFNYLSSLRHVRHSNAGLWGNGQGVSLAVAAAARPDGGNPAYLVCLLDDSVAPEDMPGRDMLERLDMPVLWLVTGRDTDRWRPLLDRLEALRDRDGKRFSIVLAPLKASREVLDAESEQSGWVEQVTEDHARLAVSWIRNLGN